MSDNLPATQDFPKLPRSRTDPSQVRKDLANVPTLSAEAYQHVGRYAGGIVLSAFEMIGGLPRLAQWADDNPTDFYTKMFGKTVARSTQVDVSGTIAIDDAITELENRQSQPVDAEFTPVYDL